MALLDDLLAKSQQATNKAKIKQKKKPKKLLQGTSNSTSLSYTINPRVVIQAPRGFLLASCDYASQELFQAAVESRDFNMLTPFLPENTLCPKRIPVPDDYDGRFDSDEDTASLVGKNPDRDLHVKAGMKAYPQYFVGQDKAYWVAIAKTTRPPTAGGKSIRDVGKVVNYGACYLQSAAAMSTTHYVPEKETKKWLKGFEQSFPDFNRWKDLKAALGLARGWMPDSVGRIRWVAESNSKGKDNSADRLAVNHCIQGACASATKLACLKVMNVFEGTPARLIGVVHDELICEIPGEWHFKEDAITDGVLDIYKIEVSEEAIKYGEIIVSCMEEAQEEIFNKIAPELGLKGKAEAAIMPFWAH